MFSPKFLRFVVLIVLIKSVIGCGSNDSRVDLRSKDKSEIESAPSAASFSIGWIPPPFAGTIELVRYHNSTHGRHFFLPAPANSQILDHDTRLTWRTFYQVDLRQLRQQTEYSRICIEGPGSGKGDKPLFILPPGPGRQEPGYPPYLTTNDAERNLLINSLPTVFLDADRRAYPGNRMTTGNHIIGKVYASQDAANSRLEIFHIYNVKNGDRIYTIDKKFRDDGRSTVVEIIVNDYGLLSETWAPPFRGPRSTMRI
jgi:hypothetical protein